MTTSPEIKVYSRRPKEIKSIGSSKKAKIAESKIANNSEPNHLWGSNATDIPSSSSLVNDRLSRLSSTARAMLIFSKAPSFLWAEAINTACYTQNRSLFRLRYNKTPYELMHDKKLDLSLCYPTNDSEDLGKLNAKADIGLVPNPIPQQPCNPPNRDDWDRLFQPIFDEYFNPLTITVSLVPVAAEPRAIDIANLPVSTLIDQDAPSLTSPKTPHFHDDPVHEDSTSQGLSSNVRPSHTLFEHLGRWTKDHPISNIIGDPSRSVSTRKQLETNAMWCYFDAFLTLVEPKNFKQAMAEQFWIDAMQEKIHEFERLQVWELVPCLDKVMLIKLKWIYNVKTDEFSGVLKNKARLVAQGFKKEEKNRFQ
ncbi:hypothetical protein Tco_0764959 [Tanacetum coccineum]